MCTMHVSVLSCSKTNTLSQCVQEINILRKLSFPVQCEILKKQQTTAVFENMNLFTLPHTPPTCENVVHHIFPTSQCMLLHK
jgi:hypothetical protein